MNNLFPKIAGKITTYIGLIVSISSLIYPSIIGVCSGILLIILGSILHELNEE